MENSTASTKAARTARHSDHLKADCSVENEAETVEPMTAMPFDCWGRDLFASAGRWGFYRFSKRSSNLVELTELWNWMDLVMTIE